VSNVGGQNRLPFAILSSLEIKIMYFHTLIIKDILYKLESFFYLYSTKTANLYWLEGWSSELRTILEW
jgi:hypothetical protein